MRRVTGLLCIILLVGFPHSVELGWPHKETAVHPHPLLLNVHVYQSFATRSASHMTFLRPDFYEVGTDEHHQYVIGLFLEQTLFPFVAPEMGLGNNYGRVKLLINGNNANVIVPISKEDPLNDRFFKNFGPENVRHGAKKTRRYKCLKNQKNKSQCISCIHLLFMFIILFFELFIRLALPTRKITF